MAGRASIVGAAETSVGKVRDHNEDCHFIDPDAGIFLVCDGMGGHAAGEVASALAVQTIREKWASEPLQAIARKWLEHSTPEAHRELMAAVRGAVVAAHEVIIAEAERDRSKGGMGTTLIGAMIVGGDVVFAQSGDSRAYLVRDGIAMQLTEDHTLLARLLAAGVDVDVDGDGARFKSMLTNALGIGQECKVSTFVVPVADGDRFLLCSDGITEYVQEAEIGEVLCKQPSPARAAQKLVDLALERGGGDNATALVVRVLEAGETARPSELLRKDQAAVDSCPLWGHKLNPQQRLRALRIALPRDHAAGEKVPAQTLGDRVAWILIEGEVEQDAFVLGPGALLYPEALLPDRPLPDKEGLARARGDVRALAIRADDFRELCDDDSELGEQLLEALGAELAARSPARRTGKLTAVAEPDTAPDDRDAEDEDDEDVARAKTIPPSQGMLPVRDDDSAPEIVITGVTDEPGEPEPAHDRAAATRAPTAPLGARTVKPLILAQEERVAAAADLDDALSKLTTDDGWTMPEPDDGARDAAPPEPELDDPDAPEVELVVAEDPAGERRVDRKESVRIGEDGARVVEVVQDTSSQTLTVTVDEPPEPEVLVLTADEPAGDSPESPETD